MQFFFNIIFIKITRVIWCLFVVHLLSVSTLTAVETKQLKKVSVMKEVQSAPFFI